MTTNTSLLQLHTQVTLRLPDSPGDSTHGQVMIDAASGVRAAIWHTAIAACAIVESFSTAPRRAYQGGIPGPEHPIREAIHVTLSLFDQLAESWISLAEGKPDVDRLTAARDGLQLATSGLSAIIVADFSAAQEAFSSIKLPRLPGALMLPGDDDKKGKA